MDFHKMGFGDDEPNEISRYDEESETGSERDETLDVEIEETEDDLTIDDAGGGEPAPLSPGRKSGSKRKSRRKKARKAKKSKRAKKGRKAKKTKRGGRKARKAKKAKRSKKPKKARRGKRK